MASSAQMPPCEMLVTLKVSFDGLSRRFKLPLRDLGANNLESNLRRLLGISLEDAIVVERYSDSASAYVMLDSNNTPVYKQLYRAAKAKQKLKLRVSNKEVAGVHKGPKPASVEDDNGAEESQPVKATNEAPKVNVQEKPVALGGPAPPVQQKQDPQILPGSGTAQNQTIDTLKDRVCEQLKRLNLDSQNRNADHLSRLILETRHRSEVVEERLSRLSLESKHRSDFQASMKKLDEIQTKLASTIRSDRRAATMATASGSVPATASGSVPATCTRVNYAVCCNSCERAVPGTHYHCSTCEDGDFDLCQACLDRGITCDGPDHWLIKRVVKNGTIINSTTERLAPKPKPQSETVPTTSPTLQKSASTPVMDSPAGFAIPGPFRVYHERTCNSCVQDLPEDQFLHCTTCEDFDLCQTCIAKDQHGHHPKHAFVPAVEGSNMSADVSYRLAPGRNQAHNAICDGCDEDIRGVRHKCLECPDWDYCGNCIVSAALIHPGHRFVPVYEPIESAMAVRSRSRGKLMHVGICCDGPLCSSVLSSANYIVGDRFKCAVCHDMDFCANCEASPANTHNRTHPLIKFKTPVRSVSVTTTGEHENGLAMPLMGDRSITRHSLTNSRATETSTQTSIATNIQTVVDVQPSEPSVPIKREESEEGEMMVTIPAAKASSSADDLAAIFVRDTITDGTSFPSNHVFEQTWVLRNEGKVAWPAGCSVKFVGGDYMGHVDAAHPAAVADLESSAESTSCSAPVAPGEEFPFTALLRTPNRVGRSISYWRLTNKDGLKFGHRLWCDIVVEKPKLIGLTAAPPKPEVKMEDVKKEAEAPAVKITESQMIFPKLEKESPVGSIHEHEVRSISSAQQQTEEEYEDCDDVEEWDQSDDGFMTDEEYDILDASDEESLEEEHKVLKK